MDKYRGDYIGFVFGEYTSSDLKIVRVSDGSRFNDSLLPSFSDLTTQVIGSNQTYYFGSNNTDKQFSLEFAFDDLSDSEFQQLKRVFATQELTKLIFDESPYKYYLVKCQDTPQIKFLCFDSLLDDGTIKRIYKGEMSVNFIAYYPYAKSEFKYLNGFNEIDEPQLAGLDNLDEWKEVSQLKQDNLYYEQVLPIPSSPTSEEETIQEWKETELYYREWSSTLSDYKYIPTLTERPGITDYYEKIVYDELVPTFKYISEPITINDNIVYYKRIIIEDSLTHNKTFAYEARSGFVSGENNYINCGSCMYTYNSGDIDCNYSLGLTKLSDENNEYNIKWYRTKIDAALKQNELNIINFDIGLKTKTTSSLVLNSNNQLVFDSDTQEILNNYLLVDYLKKIPIGEIIWVFNGFNAPRIEFNHTYY